MAKKHKKKALEEGKEDSAATAGRGEVISSRGWKVIGAGVVVLALGFYILTCTDPMGRNWASSISPFLILGAYGVIAAGILLPDAPSPAPAQTTKETPPQSNPGA